jgi:hypothetical protein
MLDPHGLILSALSHCPYVLMTRSAEAISRNMAFATLRFCGDRLDPDRITAILGVQPTKAYRKGKSYFAGPRAGYVTGRTGVWVLATDGLVDSADLDRHLEHLVDQIFGGPDLKQRLKQLHEVVSREGVTADVACFWRGAPSAQAPTISEDVIRKFRQLAAEIDTDFEVSEVWPKSASDGLRLC